MYGNFCGQFNRLDLRGSGNFAYAGTHGGRPPFCRIGGAVNLVAVKGTTSPETDAWLDQPVQRPVPGAELLRGLRGGGPDPHAPQEIPPCNFFAGPTFYCRGTSTN